MEASRNSPTSGPIVPMVLEGDNVIEKNRELMGATNYKEAAEGTIRRDFATDIEKNIVHGSGAPKPQPSKSRFSLTRWKSTKDSQRANNFNSPVFSGN
ncbi:MAG: nucleoside-diphosphate kinase [Desulfobacterales bacterium]